MGAWCGKASASTGARVAFPAVDGLLTLIVFGLVTVFVSIPGGNVIYALLGLGIFGAYSVLDFEPRASPACRKPCLLPPGSSWMW